MRPNLWTLLILLLAATSAIAASDKAKDPVRTLEAIEIEGEIAIPQVLFITSRDHPRFRDQLRERYRKSALEIGEQARWPRPIQPLTTHPEPQK